MLRHYRRCGVLSVLLAVTAPVFAQSASTAPSGYAAERALRDLITAINSGDSGQIASFAAARYDSVYLSRSGGAPRAVRRWLEIHETYGPLSIDSIVTNQAARADAWIVGTISRAWLDYRVGLDSITHRISRVGLGRGVRPDHRRARHARIADVQLSVHLEQHLRSLASADLFSGTVLVARDTIMVYQGAFGFADGAGRVRNRIDTRFDLASVGKLFTAVAIAQLAEAGKLSFGDTIARFQLDLPQAITRRITVEQLLNHTSGLGEIGPALDSAMRMTRSVPEMIELLTDTSLSFAPGSSTQYSNRGYLILGAVIEAVSGRDYFSYVEDHIFTPAGMSQTAFFADEAPVTNRAERLSRFPTLRSAYVPGPRRPTPARLDVRGGPAGGVYSTVGDLFSFVRGLEQGRLLSPAMRGRLTTSTSDIRPGYGFDLIDGGGYGHRGAAPGATASLFFFRSGHTVAVLSNYDSAAQLVGEYVRERTGN